MSHHLLVWSFHPKPFYGQPLDRVWRRAGHKRLWGWKLQIIEWLISKLWTFSLWPRWMWYFVWPSRKLSKWLATIDKLHISDRSNFDHTDQNVTYRFWIIVANQWRLNFGLNSCQKSSWPMATYPDICQSGVICYMELRFSWSGPSHLSNVAKCIIELLKK